LWWNNIFLWLNYLHIFKVQTPKRLICTNRRAIDAIINAKLCTLTTHYGLPINTVKCQLHIMDKYEANFCMWWMIYKLKNYL